jgi:hypothetical protein
MVTIPAIRPTSAATPQGALREAPHPATSPSSTPCPMVSHASVGERVRRVAPPHPLLLHIPSSTRAMPAYPFVVDRGSAWLLERLGARWTALLSCSAERERSAAGDTPGEYADGPRSSKSRGLSGGVERRRNIAPDHLTHTQHEPDVAVHFRCPRLPWL